MPIKMFCKDANVIVMVYAFDLIQDKALIYNPWLAEKQNGNGWRQVKISKLIPLDVEKEESSLTTKEKIMRVLERSN